MIHVDFRARRSSLWKRIVFACIQGLGSHKVIRAGRRTMIKLIQTLGDVAAALGVLFCAAAGLARLFHTWSTAGLQIGALFNLGIALMVLACLAKLQVLTSLALTESRRK